MFVFWKVQGIPESSEAENRARFALARLPLVTGIAQGQHTKGAFRVTLNYPSGTTGKEELCFAVQSVLRQVFGDNTITAEEDVEAYRKE